MVRADNYGACADVPATPVGPNAPGRRRQLGWFTVGVGLLVFSGLVLSRRNSGELSQQPLAALEKTSGTYQFQVKNEYTALNLSYYSWAHIAEPYRTSTLEVSGHESDREYTWTVSPHDDTDANLTGSSISYVFTRAGTSYDVALSVDGSVRAQAVVLCKYVRREIRQLQSADLDRFFAATAAVHRLTMQEGQSKYGEKFVNYEYFTVKHLASMSIDGCTPFHNQDVFMTAHEAFVLEFDQAVQSVDPSVTTPFWDYTLDEELYGVHWWEQSPMFGDGWFGGLNTSHASGNILRGKWFAGIPNGWALDVPERNSYGIITDRTNNNPSMFVTRSNEICGLTTRAELPSCKTLRGVLATPDFHTFRETIEGQFHGVIHMAMGGVTDCPHSFLDAVERWPHLTGFFEGLGLMLNTVWRTMLQHHVVTDPSFSEEFHDGVVDHKHPANASVTARNPSVTPLMVCPHYCSLDTPFANCSCTCPSIDEKIMAGTMDKIAAYRILEKAGVLGMLLSERSTSNFIETVPNRDNELVYRFRNTTTEETEELIVLLLQIACHPGKLGQYATPLAATNDPIFWPTHSSWGRLWAYVRLDPAFSAFNHSWTNVHPDCQGMYEYKDTLPFKNFLPGESGDHYYSNQELVQLLDPRNPALPYMYEDFKWAHCESSEDDEEGGGLR